MENTQHLNLKAEGQEIHRRNNSTLGVIDCMMRLTGDEPFESFSDDDLDSIYAVAFNRWAYHLTRDGYIKALYKKRKELQHIKFNDI